MQVECIHIYKLALDSCGHSQLSPIVETFVMSGDENLSCDNIHIKPYQLSLGAQLLSLFISIFHKKNHN